MSGQIVISDRKRTWIFINIIISCVGATLLSTALSTALAPISSDLGVSLTTGQWMVSGYSLAMAIITPLTAFLIRRFHTKRLYICGCAVFATGLFIDLLAPGFFTMMVGRVFQACGNGILVSMAQTILLTIYPEERKGSVMGWYGLAVSVAPVIAPTIGGILVDQISWRAIFGLGLTVILISLIMACIVFDNVLDVQKKKFDTMSFVFSSLAFGGITLGVGNIVSLGITDAAVLLSLVIGILAATAFIYRQCHLKDPFLDVLILKVRQYACGVASVMLLYLVVMASSVLMPLYVQSVMGYSATISGLVTLPGSLAMAVVSPLAGKLYDRIGINKLFLLGAVCLFGSNLGMYFVTLEMPLVIAALWNVVRYIAVGCLLMPLTTWCTSFVGENRVADATSLLIAFRTIAGAIGSAVFVGIMTLISENSVSRFGTNADIHGLNVAFLFLSAAPAVLIVLAIRVCKFQRKVL
ncbi:MAG: DHA2 family efflux MFS transporter permease subunit [Clostridiales bacterium]|nr:DHA2 family efflux MFS transporter permease subunit [Clostridiales bacterium]